MMTLVMCSACGKDKAYKDGLCVGCWSRQNITKILRKQEKASARKPPLKTCINPNCQKSGHWHYRRCPACRQYFVTKQTERPPELCRRILNKNQNCRNCGRLGLQANGRCTACHAYYLRHGVDRGETRSLESLSKLPLIVVELESGKLVYNVAGVQFTKDELRRQARLLLQAAKRKGKP